MAYDLTPRVGDSAHRLLFKIAAATSDVADPPNPDAPENQLLRRIAAATAAGAESGGADVAFADITGAPGDNAALAAALALKLDAAGGTMTGALVNSANGAASTPPLKLNGTAFTGGSGTTTKPSLLIEPTGTTSTGWNTSGTMLGVNSPSGFSGTALSIQKNGVESVNIRHDGWVVSQFGFGANNWYNSSGGQVLIFGTIAGDSASVQVAGNMSLKNGAATIAQGAASPEASVIAPPGSTYQRNNSGTGELWLKTSGTGNTGWTKVL